MLLQIDGTILFAAISFIIFVMIMNIILYKPLVKIMDEREKFLAKNRQTALASKQKAQEVIENKEKEINLSRAEASNLLKEVSKYAALEREKAVKETKKLSSYKMNEKKSNLDSEINTVKAELKNEIENFVALIAGKVLNKDVKVNLSEEKVINALNLGGNQNA